MYGSYHQPCLCCIIYMDPAAVPLHLLHVTVMISLLFQSLGQKAIVWCLLQRL